MAIYRDVWWRNRLLWSRPLRPGKIISLMELFPDTLKVFEFGRLKVLNEDQIGLTLGEGITTRPKFDIDIVTKDRINERDLSQQLPFGISVEYRWQPSREITRV